MTYSYASERAARSCLREEEIKAMISGNAVSCLYKEKFGGVRLGVPGEEKYHFPISY
jgi:hypothetical protein